MGELGGTRERRGGGERGKRKERGTRGKRERRKEKAISHEILFHSLRVLSQFRHLLTFHC